MKKIFAALLSILLLTASAGAAELYIDTSRIDAGVPPVIVEGRTLVPVRSIFEGLGAVVEWDKDARTATGTLGETVVVMQIDSRTAYINGEAKPLDVPAQIINGRTMAPARFISEALNCQVTWDGGTKTAAVANRLNGQKLYAADAGTQYHFDGRCQGGAYREETLAAAMGRHLTPCEICVLKTESGQTAPENPSEPAAAAQRVYITRTGKRYHVNSQCNGGTYYASTLAEAKRRGLTPCRKCAGG